MLKTTSYERFVSRLIFYIFYKKNYAFGSFNDLNSLHKIFINDNWEVTEAEVSTV
jgi:hypothetical protein